MLHLCIVRSLCHSCSRKLVNLLCYWPLVTILCLGTKGIVGSPVIVPSQATSISVEVSPAHKAWLNPCVSTHHVLPRGYARGNGHVPVASSEQLPSLRTIARSLDDTLITLVTIQDQLLAYYDGNTGHLVSDEDAHSYRPLPLQVHSGSVDPFVMTLYQSLARVASLLYHMRISLHRHQNRFARRKFTDMLAVLENGGIVDGKVNNGGIYHILCDVYRLVSASHGDIRRLDVDDVAFTYPLTVSQLHDKFFSIVTSTESVIRDLQQHLAATSNRQLEN